MGQNESNAKKENINNKFLNIIIYNVLLNSDKTMNFPKITTYKELLLYVFSNNLQEYHKLLSDPSSNKIKKSLLYNNFIYCNEIYYYQNLNNSKYSNNANNANYSDCPDYCLNYNRKYLILHIFYIILKVHKINSLDSKIDKQMLNLILNKIDKNLNEHCNEKNVLACNLERFNDVNSEIGILCNKYDKYKNVDKKKSIDNTIKHRHFELNKINRLKIKNDKNTEYVNNLQYFKLSLTGKPILFYY